MYKIDPEKVLYAFEHLEPLRDKMRELNAALKEIDDEYMKFWRETTFLDHGYNKNGDRLKFCVFHHPYRSPRFVIRDGGNFFDKLLFECSTHKEALRWIFEQCEVEEKWIKIIQKIPS